MTLNRRTVIVLSLAVFIAVFAGHLFAAHAAVTNNPPPTPVGGSGSSGSGGTLQPVVKNVSGAKAIFCNVLSWIYTFAIITGVYYVLRAAFDYIRSRGQGEGIEQANHALIYAMLGIAVAMLARAAPSLVADVLNAPGQVRSAVSSACP